MAKDVKLSIPLEQLSEEAKEQLLDALLGEKVPDKAKPTLAFARAARQLGFHREEFVALMVDFRQRH